MTGQKQQLKSEITYSCTHAHDYVWVKPVAVQLLNPWIIHSDHLKYIYEYIYSIPKSLLAADNTSGK